MMASDSKTGISIRFIRQFDVAKAQHVRREDTFALPADAALFLAMRDGRDVPMAEKVADAWEFVHSRLQSPEPISDTETPK